MVLANIENLLADLGEGNVQVELVVNGEGIMALLRVPGQNASKVERLASRGVRFLACDNSLRAMDVAQEALLAGVEVVSSGVGHLVHRQAEGWAYLRP
jgi:uncharacterized protein